MPNLSLYVYDRIYIPISEAPPAFIEALKKANTHSNPQFELMRRLRKRYAHIPKQILLWGLHRQEGREFLALPVGCREEIARFAAQHNIPLHWEDRTLCPKLNHPIAAPVAVLDGFQKRALIELLKHPNGCLQAPTGAGKTNILMSCVQELQTPTIILVHTLELLRQTRLRCKQWLGIDTGIIGAGQYDVQPVTVAMIQSLSRLPLRGSPLAKTFGAVIVDEVHHSPCKTWAKILNALPARHKYGFTATAWRKDRLQFIIWKVIGDIRWKVSQQEAIDAGRIMRPTIKWAYTKFRYVLLNTGQWPAMISAIVKDEKRNRFIERVVRKRLTPGTNGLILTDRIRHARKLAIRLKDLNPILLVGDMESELRKRAMAKIRKGTHLTIATIHLLGEGVDVPGWDMLFLVSPFSTGPRVLQALGRIARTAPNKSTATLIDFVDECVPKLLKAAQGRKQLYLNI